jgi:hypothetical protein
MDFIKNGWDFLNFVYNDQSFVILVALS